MIPSDVWETGQNQNEHLEILERRPPARERVGAQPSGLIGGGRTPLNLEVVNCQRKVLQAIRP